MLNIDMDLDEEMMKCRIIDPDDVRSDFDEYKGLGCPSIDSFTLDQVSVDNLDLKEDLADSLKD